MPHKVDVVWSASADNDLLRVITRIAEENPFAAQALLDEIVEKAGKLTDNPKLYAVSDRASAFRQLTVRANYLLYYQVLTEENPQQVLVVAVVHARQAWPD